MSPLLVMRESYDVKGPELGPSHFIGWQACNVGRVKYQRLDMGTNKNK